MRAFALGLLAVVAGCPAEGDDFPINPGGGGGAGGNGGRDAATDSDDSGTNLTGRVCLVSDLRRPTTGCSTTDAGDITVTLGTKLAITNADGTFTIETPSGSNLVWHASGTTIVTSAMPFAAEFVIPAITVDDYADLLISNGVLLTPGQGSIVARVVRGTVAVTGAIASVIPAPAFAPFYDGSSSAVWDRDSTGQFGTIWITGAAGGATTMQVSNVSSTQIVEDQAITFGTIDLP
jgi:hypothetical protein